MTAPKDGAFDTASILENVRALSPRIEEAAKAVDQLREMPSEIKTMLRDAGVFRCAFPKSMGGPEMSLDDQIRMVEIVARADASVAWNVMILIDSGFWAGALSDKARVGLYSDLDLATAGALNPPGRAEKVEGGYRLTGRWPFGSGVTNSDLICTGANVWENGQPVLAEDGSRKLYCAFIQTSDATMHDTWRTIGLRGSGSCDYSVEDLFVPEDHLIEYDAEGNPDLPPLSKYTDVMMVNQWGVVLGLASRVLDHFEAFAKTHTGRSGPLRKEYRVQVGLAEARALYEAARALALTVAADTNEALFTRPTLTLEERARLPATAVMVADLARRSMEKTLEIAGVGAIFEGSLYERSQRDMLTAIRHVIHQPKFYQVTGALRLGETPYSPYG